MRNLDYDGEVPSNPNLTDALSYHIDAPSRIKQLKGPVLNLI